MKYLLPTILLLLSGLQLQAQLYLRGVPHIKSSTNARKLATSSSDTTLNLPFWDDFSSSDVVPDTAIRWTEGSINVIVHSGIGIEAPSLNVAVLDGWDAYGQPYDEDGSYIGICDSLTSRPIDLSDLTSGEQDSTYFSFFYEKEGLGDLPEETDSLYLQFKTEDGTWAYIWSVNGENAGTDQFYQVILKLGDSEYFHDSFQFRFVSYGRQSGGYDSWLLDYIYLNKGRHANDTVYLDRALSEPPSSFLAPYTAVPFVQFSADPSAYLGSISSEFVNLDNDTTATDYASILIDYVSGDTIQIVNEDGPISNKAPLPFERVVFETPDVIDEGFDSIVDSIYVKSLLYLQNTGDTVLGPLADFKSNDTISALVVIDQEMAYDDGTAEYALGTNGAGSELAYQFAVPEADELTGVKIFFPEFEEGTGDEAITIKVWRNLDGLEESELTSEYFSVLTSATINEFQYYEFSSAISVADTFYIGYEQESEGFLTLGYDRNTSSGDKIYFRGGPGEDWQQNTTKYTGSLMLRPYFGREGIIGLEDDLNILDEVVCYPNPVTDILTMEGEFDEIHLRDIAGRSVSIDAASSMGLEPVSLDVSQIPPGIYLLSIIKNEATKTIKLIKR